MKKICTVLFMVAVLTVSLWASAQNGKREATPKVKTEQADKKSGENKAVCCADKKHDANAKSAEGKACCAEKKDKACCENGKAKSSVNKETAATETKSCGKKK